MSGSFTAYDPATGQILGVLMTSRQVPADTPERAYIPGLWAGDAFHVVDGAPISRPALAGFDKAAIVADGADEAVLLGLPDPCTVLIDGEPHEVTGGELRLSSSTAASYRVTVDQFPYAHFEATVTAT